MGIKKIWIIILIGLTLFTAIMYSNLQSISLKDNNDNLLNISNEETIVSIYEEEVSYTAINYVSDEIYNLIRNIYKTDNFLGDIKKVDITQHQDFLVKFSKLLNCEISFMDEATKDEIYLDRFQEMNGSYNINEYLYYYFDMDGDNSPELCITDEIRFVYIFKYDAGTDKVLLWKNLNTTWLKILGSQEIVYIRSGAQDTTYGFIKLNQTGDEEYSLWFYSEAYNIDDDTTEVAYMVSLPNTLIEATGNDNLVDILSGQGYIKNNHTERPYYKVTKIQYEELTQYYLDIQKLSKQKLVEVSYMYNELFNN